MKVFFLFAGFLALWCNMVYSATYYVATNGNDSAGNGSLNSPWATIGYADRLGVLNPGDTVIVQAGKYPQSSSAGVLLLVDGGTASEFISYIANGSVVIDQSTNSGATYGFQVTVPGILLSGFEITGAEHGICLEPGSGSCIVSDCVIHDASAIGQNAEGVYVNQSPNDTIKGNVIYNITDTSDAEWSPIGCGVRDSDSDNLNVFNNTMDNCYVGVFYYGAGFNEGPYGHITTYNNIVVNSAGWGFANPWSLDSTLFSSGYNLVYNDQITFGNYPGDSTGSMNGPGPTDVAANPQFINEAMRDYYLSSTSPALEAGTNVGLPYIGAQPTIGAFGPLFLISQLPNETAVVGEPATFTATVESEMPYTLKWLINGVVIPGATNKTYTLPLASTCDNGAVLSVVASNGFGSATNSGTVLTVIPPNPSLAINVGGTSQGSNRLAQLTLSGQSQQWNDIDASTNLSDWFLLGKVYGTNDSASLADVMSATGSRFYRARPALPDPSFSFTYNGVSSTQFLNGWTSNQTVTTSNSMVEKTTVYGDPVTGLQVTCQETEYMDFPAEEWVLYFENTGTSDTPILEQVNAADVTLQHGSCGEFELYYAKGCSALVTDFEPFETNLFPNMEISFAPAGGRSSQDTAFPYYNVVSPDGTGDILAIGWSGEWAATFSRDATTNLDIKAGMQLTHLILHPGEKIRTPSILMLGYAGNRMDGQNLFRKLLLQHYTPLTAGRPVVTPVAASPAGYISFITTTVTNMVQAITNIALNQFPVDTSWIDTGWFPFTNSWEFGTGNWVADPARYPNGMAPVANAAHTNGMRFLLWFEPERVMPGTTLYNSHPEWLLSGDANIAGVPCYLLNLGNPAALNWAETNFSAMITNIGVDIFRIDFNMEPLTYWRGNDATNRQGMTEINYIEGLYSFLDILRSNVPSLMIDNSSAAGHRLDLEMTRRSVPLLRTDYLWDPVGAQCMEYALSLWLPYQGQGAVALDSYDFLSGMGETAVYCYNYGVPADPWWASGTEMVDQYKSIKQYYLGDFYPLTQYSTNNADWLAYQFNLADTGSGMVQAFRRGANGVSSKSLPLSGLDANAQYAISNLNASGVTYMSGMDLMSEGLPVTIAAQPGAVVFTYQETQ